MLEKCLVILSIPIVHDTWLGFTLVGVPQPPHVILVICHDLGRMLGCYGASVATPHLDRLASQSFRFDNVHCSSTACTPARACLMTGQHAHTHGAVGLAHVRHPLPAAARTIVDELNDGGFETVHVGLQHERRTAAENRYGVELHRDHRDCFVERAVDTAVAFLDTRRNADRPFFLNIGTVETHPQRWGPSFHDDRAARYEPLRPPTDPLPLPPFVEDEPAMRESASRFYGAIAYLDRELGRLFDAIELLGLDKSSWLIFTTDHGPALGPRTKATLYPHGTEVAMLMRPPGGLGSTRAVPHLLQTIDVAPTLLDLLQLPVPSRMQGRSFWPAIGGGGRYAAHDRIFLERNYHGQPDAPGYYEPTRAVRMGRLLYIRYAPSVGPQREELYDLAADPHARHDIAQATHHRATRTALARSVDQWMRQTDDPLLRGPMPGTSEPSGG